MLELPSDRPHPKTRSYRGGLLTRSLDADLTANMRDFNRANGATDFMTLISAFGLLLSRYSGQHDLLIGSPVANRRLRECEDLAGMFVNTLALRWCDGETPDFAALVKETRRRCLRVYANQDLPFELLVDHLQPERSLMHSPLFQVMFVMQNAPLEQLVFDGTETRLLEPPVTVSKFDLTLYVEPSGDGFVTRWEYNADIFDEEAGRLLTAGSYLVSDSVHLHSNGRDTDAHLEIGFRFHPVGYAPKFKDSFFNAQGNGVDISVEGDAKDQELHAYQVLTQNTKVITFEPHLHAPGERMCLEAIWGYSVETISCVGYDHNWVRGYGFEDNYTPLLPKGTILHITGYFDNTKANPNVPDPRNWQGSGNRSVTNMFIDLGIRVTMTDEQFKEEMETRRRNLNLGPNDHVIGCPLCLAPLVWPLESDSANANEQLDDKVAGN